MRLFSVCTLIALICPGIVSSQREAKADLVITNIATVDTQGGATETRTVVIRGGTIDAVLAPGVAAPDAVTTLDGRGKFLIPGLWDMHVHLATSPEPLFAERIMLPLFLAHGVVGVRDMGGPLERVLALRDRVSKGALDGPRIITPGPFLDGAGDPDSMFMRATTAEDARTAVRELSKAGVDFVKVQANLTREPYDAAIQEARARNLSVAGHVPVFLPVSHIVASGQRTIEHISPALVGDAGLLFACSRREDELRDELMAIERDRAKTPADQIRARESRLRAELVGSFDPEKAAALGRLLKEHRTWMVPTLIWSNSFRPLHQADTGADLPLDLIPATMRKRLVDNRARYLKAAAPESLTAAANTAGAASRAVGVLQAAGAPILAGTDTYDGFVVPGFSLHQELRLLAAAGLSPLEVLQAATRNGALLRNAIDTEGTVARGKRADLVILEADPLLDARSLSRIHAVVLNGRLVSRTALDGLLESVRTAAR